MPSRRAKRSRFGESRLSILLSVGVSIGAMIACQGPGVGGDFSQTGIGRSEALRPGLGRDATAPELARLDLRIDSEGRALPSGRGTAIEGEAVYIANCLRCHGLGGAGKPADRLVGGVGSLTSARPIKTVGSYWPHAPMLYDYVRRAMPYDRPGSLSSDELYAVVAYLLAENGIIEDQEEMNPQSLPEVEMPNRDGFISAVAPGRDE